MIYFFSTSRNRMIRLYLRTVWPREEGARFVERNYESIRADESPPSGLYVFSDVELLSGEPLARARALHARLRAEPEKYRVWNDPGLSARRFDILDALAKSGDNDFRAFRADEPLPEDLRFPVFVREENEHTGALTPLLHSGGEIKAALAALTDKRPLLVVEFLDYADADGVYAKYSAFRIGDMIVRKHMLFSSEWMLKQPMADGKLQDMWLAKESGYLASSDGDDEIRALFERFGIDYGRIDYTLVDGRIQVFEINTNPVQLKPANLRPNGRRLFTHRHYFEHSLGAWRAADPDARPGLLTRLRWRMHRPKLKLRAKPAVE